MLIFAVTRPIDFLVCSLNANSGVRVSPRYLYFRVFWSGVSFMVNVGSCRREIIWWPAPRYITCFFFALIDSLFW